MAAVMQSSPNLNGSSNLSQALSQASQKNQALLQELAQTEYAKPSAKSNVAYIADLQARIAKSDKQIKTLHLVTESERKDHLKYQESLVKRYAYKLGGSKGEKKFSDKASKEEREFVEAWQKERDERETREELGRALTQAETDRAHLETDLARNTKAQAELDALYQSIFGGPTPEFPNEDHMEDIVRQATEHFHKCQGESKVEQQAWEALNQGKISLGKAGSLMREAEDYSRGDIFGSKFSQFPHDLSQSNPNKADHTPPVPFADYMERDRMSSAQAAIHIAQQHSEFHLHHRAVWEGKEPH
jgi:hypothetical protein